ncbi:hypothetical protein [Virgibacillus sp. Bac332]|uniref:hypothetical protein n=1 Tax=Virgibacillus sp. Bac332 TaxID=2419842 RepID=UPI0013CF3D19|nr:hypothetical protein [Virgibacillus sp. Bac332]
MPKMYLEEHFLLQLPYPIAQHVEANVMEQGVDNQKENKKKLRHNTLIKKPNDNSKQWYRPLEVKVKNLTSGITTFN